MPTFLDTLVFNIHNNPTLFYFFDTANMGAHVKKIMTGTEYPIPALPPNFQFHTVVDIGANIGAAALWFIHRAPQARLVCFEPSKDNFAMLQRNLLTFPQAEAHPCGLFSQDRQTLLHLGLKQSMQHSIIPIQETSTRTDNQIPEIAAARIPRPED